MASRDERNLDVEHLYRNVMHEIGKALSDGDVDRANAMANRAATGRPKVLPRLDVETEETQLSLPSQTEEEAA